MPKEAIDPDSIIPYKNSQNQVLLAHKQIQKKVWEASGKTNKDTFQKFENKLEDKNTYFARSKIPDINNKDLSEMEAEVQKIQRGSAFNKDDSYCQKCPTMRNKCPHKSERTLIKDKYSYPITTSSTYGWLEPIDKISENHHINSQIQGFYDKSHL